MKVLQGIKVLDFSSNVAGPNATLTLHRLGASVIKVERPDGDPSRRWAPFVEGKSVTFDSLNRGKRSIAVALKSRAGLEVVRKLIAESDVMVHNFVPSVAERLCLDESAVRAVNENIIYCSVGAFGNGPEGSRIPGYDPIAQAFSGILQMTGYEDGPGARCAPSMIDMGTGQWAVIGILLGLLQRHQPSAPGASLHSVDANLIDTAMGFIPYQAVHALTTGERPRRYGTGNPLGTPHEVFATSDSAIFVAAPDQAKWTTLLGVLDAPWLTSDPRFSTSELRLENRAQLSLALGERFRLHTTAHWQDKLLTAGVAVAPVLHLDETVRHSLATERQWFEPGPAPIVRLPLVLNGSMLKTEGSAPRLGEHSRDILLELGYLRPKAEALLTEKTVVSSDALDRGPAA